MTTQEDLVVSNLGECLGSSPLALYSGLHDEATHFVNDSMRIHFDVGFQSGAPPRDELSFEEAGPRRQIFFNPKTTCAAIVTCGGLSPGLNNVIRSVYYELTKNYGVRRVLGIRNGYLGLNPASGREPIVLTSEFVDPIHKLGGTVLGSSRGHQEPAVIADCLQAAKIDILICVGGDGTQRGAHAIHDEICRRKLPVSVVGIPKTIDNDIPYVTQSFGFVTALEKAAEVIRGAHVEAKDAVNGIGLVKLMGRHAGFIAAGASVVSQEVNFTLVPEIAFPLEGENGLLPSLERRLREREHAVIVVAEGAGQHLFTEGDQRRDASGNVRFRDIGWLLQEKIGGYFTMRSFPVSVKYLDPSYHIRSVPANAFDRFLCDQMGRHAVHAAMAGKTGMLVGYEHGQFVHVPIPTVVAETKELDLAGDLWRAVLQGTGQPRWGSSAYR